ncbi:MAG: tyrosine-type recombinase/integrase [Chlorobiaceae bacterium]|nr:tyrosine-type recombinase/integrase [Chlorobiaceae bacterium]
MCRKTGQCRFPGYFQFTVREVHHRSFAQAVRTKQISFLCGRHTFAAQALSNGVPIRVISDWFGHSSGVQTEVYARLLADERDRYAGAVSLKRRCNVWIR